MKEIVIIDDDEVIRLALSSLVSRYFKEVRTYTSGDGVQGLGYIFVTKPDLIIVDLTLPKYSGKEVIDFISTNEFILSQKIPVILLTENESSLDTELPNHFIKISKGSINFIEEVIRIVSRFLSIEAEIKEGFRERLFKKLSSRLIHKSNKVDEVNESRDRKDKLKRLILSPYIFLLQLNLSIYISLFFLFYRHQESEENIELQKRDLARFRVRTYSAVGIALASFFVIFLQLILLSGGLFSAFIFGNKVVQAASYTWDGGGTDGTCGGNVGDGNKWSCAANWSLDIVPTSADTVTFNGTSTKDAVIDPAFGGVVTSINIASGYTGTITQQRSLQTTSTFTQATGTYSASNQTLDIDSTFTLSGGSFTASSGTTFIGGTLTVSGAPTFNANSGTVTFDGSSPGHTCNNIVFNLVTINSSASMAFNSGCTIPLGNNPTLGGSGTVNINGGTLTGSGKFTKSTGTFAMSNAASQLTGFTQFEANAVSLSSDSVLDLSSYTSVLFNSTLNLSSGTITVPSGTDFNLGITISGGTFNAPSGNMTLDGNLTVSGAGVFNANGGTVTFDGTQFSSATCNGMNFSNVVVAATGTAIKGFTGCPSIPLGNNPTTTRTSFANSTVSGTGTWTMVGGGDTSFVAGAVINGFTGISAQGFTVNGANLNLSGLSSFVQGPAGNTVNLSSGSLQLPNGADINGNLTISGGAFTAPSGTMTLAGSLNISGAPTFNANGGTLNFDGAGGGGTTSCNNVTFNLVTFTFPLNTRTISSNCTIPLGNNPVLATANGSTQIINNGTLTGTGTLNTGVFNFNTGSSLVGFTGINLGSTFTIAGGTANFSGYTSFTTGAAGSAPIILSSGSLSLPSGADLNSSLTISGGTFTAPSGAMTLAGALTISGAPTFNANGGTVIFDGGGSATLSCNNITFNLVVISSTGTKTVGTNCNLPLGTNPTATVATLILNGTLSGIGTLTVSNNLTFNNSAATLSGFTGIVVGSTLTLQNNGSSNLNSFTTATLNAVTLASNAGVLTLPNGADINGGLTISGGTFNAPSGTMSLAGALTVTGTPVFNANGGTFNFDGAVDATLSCNSVVFSLVTFTHTGASIKTISNNCTIPVGNNPTVTGRIRLNSATATLTGSGLFTSTCELSNCLRVTGGSFTGFSGLIAYGGVSADGGNLNLSSYSPVTIYGRNASSSISISSGGVFTAPSGTMMLYDKINNGGGTFNHNNGTVEFSTENDDRGIGLSTDTVVFNNLKATVTIPSDFSFISGTTTTVLGTFEMKGTSGNLLSLMTDTLGVQWNLDVSNATNIDLEYLNVTDSNSLNRIIQTAGLNVTDGGNNINWNFANPEISEVGPSNLIDGSLITENKPTFEFKILDPDSANQIKYTLIVDNNSDFSSPEVEFESEFIDQGEITFTPTNNLSDDEYYWKIQAEDSQEGTAEYLANEGKVAFVLDATKPTGSVIIQEADSRNPYKTLISIQATDNLSGVDQMIVSQNPNFTNATYEAFSTTKEIEFPKTNGAKGIYVKVKDRAGNESDTFAASIIIFVQNNPVEEVPDVEVGEKERVYTVRVKVVNERNKEIENAEVELGKILRTDKEGIAEFQEIQEGTYTLIVNYKDQRIETKVQITGERQEILIKIVLEGGRVATIVYLSIVCVLITVILLIFLLLFLLRRKKRLQDSENS